MPRLTYTQHSAAFPKVPMGAHPSVYDQISVSLDADGGGTVGEFKWEFYRFDRDNAAAHLCCFGDGLPCLFDPRVQRVVAEWRAMANPDDLNPPMLIALLAAAGAVPSEYMPR